MMFIKAAIIIIILFINDNGYSQQFSLTECIEFAYSHRAELKKQKNTNATFVKQFEYSKYELLPSVSSDINHRFNGNRTVNISNSE